MLRSTVLIVAATLATACVETPPTSCFDVTAGAWSPIDATHVGGWPRPGPPDESGDSVLVSLPPRIRLDPAPAGAGLDSFHTISIPEDALQVPHSGHWWRSWSDSLELVFSDGYVGSVTRLAQDEDGWAGHAETFSDIMDLLRYERPVRLRSVKCESPPPVPASADRPLLRTIPLADSLRLVLGDSIPLTLETTQRRTGALTVLAAPTAEFAGSDTVVVVPTAGGVIKRIELLYPEGSDLTDLAALLKSEYAGYHTSEAVRGVFWENRTTEVFLVLGPRPRLVMEDPRLH